MSDLKISKKQHQLVKSLKQSRALGDLDNLHVQPYKEFVKEEHKKLQEHWIQLANEDRSAAYICRLCFRIRLIKKP
ncbi:hypothetical protein NC651_026162 [Populus alba x Populus x berolinensis]|nr:hypothetical protein NC651_026162 [Populus alba x Populus x berolinensis]